MLKSRIPLIVSQLPEQVLEAVTELGERVVEGAQERVAVDTGGLRDSIHLEVEENTVRVVAGDEDNFHGHLVEGGTTKTPARPFLVPAYEAEKDNLHDLVEDHLEGL